MTGAVGKPKKRVLAVDDEEEILRLYETFLQHRGYEIMVLNSAPQCLAYLATNHADILLLDVNMPGVDGLQVLEMIKADERLMDMRVIIITARHDEATVREAVKLGCDSYIVKPFKLKDLSDRITMELFALTDADLRVICKRPGSIKTGILTEPGFQTFSALHWDPYPVKFNDRALCLLIPRGVRLAHFAKASTDELEKRVVVFCRHPQRWKKIWPERR